MHLKPEPASNTRTASSLLQAISCVPPERVCLISSPLVMALSLSVTRILHSRALAAASAASDRTAKTGWTYNCCAGRPRDRCMKAVSYSAPYQGAAGELQPGGCPPAPMFFTQQQALCSAAVQARLPAHRPYWGPRTPMNSRDCLAARPSWSAGACAGQLLDPPSLTGQQRHAQVRQGRTSRPGPCCPAAARPARPQSPPQPPGPRARSRC